MVALAPRTRRVGLVTADAASELAQRTLEALTAKRLEARVVGVDELPGEGVHVLIDDPSLPAALARLIHRLPGRELLPEVVLVTATGKRSGLLLSEGFRDVVPAVDAGQAVVNILSEQAPVAHEWILRELEGRFLPALVTELGMRASEAGRLLGECIDLVRAIDRFARHRTRLEKLARRQGIDEAYVAAGLVDAFAVQLAEVRRPRPTTLRRFPVSRLGRTTLGTGEPRVSARDKTLVADTIAWLDNADLIKSLAPAVRAELDTIAKDQGRAPLAALRACLELLDRERSERLARVQSLHQGPDPRAAIESWLGEQHGFQTLPPSFAMPEHQARLIASHVHPPPEIYRTWCIDLAAMRLVMTSEVLGIIARELNQNGQAGRRATPRQSEPATKEQ